MKCYLYSNDTRAWVELTGAQFGKWLFFLQCQPGTAELMGIRLATVGPSLKLESESSEDGVYFV